MFDTSKPYRTRDGRKAEILRAYTARGGEKCLSVIITHDDGTQSCMSLTQDGQFFKHGESDSDLVNYEIEPAPLDLSKPMQMRNGKPVEFLTTLNSTSYQLVFKTTDECGSEGIIQRLSNGRWTTAGENVFDVINVPEELSFGDQPATKVLIDQLAGIMGADHLSAIASATGIALNAKTLDLGEFTKRKLREVYYLAMQARLLQRKPPATNEAA